MTAWEDIKITLIKESSKLMDLIDKEILNAPYSSYGGVINNNHVDRVECNVFTGTYLNKKQQEYIKRTIDKIPYDERINLTIKIDGEVLAKHVFKNIQGETSWKI